MDFLTDPIFSEFGRSDFIGGIDNEALDFGHLEQFIHVAAGTGPVIQGAGNSNSNGTGQVSTPPNGTQTVPGGGSCGSIVTQSHLPESPPDSGSEPPYSPADLQSLTLTTAATVATAATTNSSNAPTTNGGGGNPTSAGSGGDGGANGVRNGNTNPPSVSSNGSNVNGQALAISHSITTVPHGHGQPPGTPGQQTDLTSDITTLTDISQTSIALNGVASIHHHHNGHHTLLTNQNHHHPHPQQQHALFLRSEQASEQQPNGQNVGTISIRKHGDILLGGNQTEALLVVPQQTSVTSMLDLERSYHNQQNLLAIGPTQINTEDLSKLMPEVYSTTHPTPPPISISTRSGLTTPVHCRKRKLSQPDSGPPIVKPEPGSSLSPICQQHLDPGSPVSTNLGNMNSTLSIPDSSLDGSVQNADSSDPCPLQCIRFTPFQQQNWHTLCDQSLQELPVPHYRVDADKGFNFSNSDDAFVCQKKNHFQITCHAQLQGAATFVRTSSGLEKIKSFHLHFYGVKLEAPNQTIRVEQSQSDRSKKPFHPVPIDLQNRLVSKITVGRLHFSETTSNNMRKKGRPNPEQRYFQLVVGLHAHTHSGHFPVVSQGSERIIVRASNPGQFESDVELCWQRGVTQDSIYHAGRVGINTDRPDESLVVHGNLKISGHIVQPSDSRAKQEISELDTSQQLKNLQKIRVVRYRYEPEFAIHSGLKTKDDGEEIIDTGVIAQEVQEVLPDAVQEAGSIVLPNGQVIENFLLVNKDRILMENIGAVKELCKVTGSLETRIEQLEKINSRLMRIQQLDRNHNCSTKKCKHVIDEYDENEEICSNKTIQMVIIVLVIIMAVCLAAISTLYFVEHSKQRERFYARYDRYDVSQYISHDAILINNNHNRNEYHTDRRQNHKVNSILSAYTIRPHQASIDSNPNPNPSDDQREVMTYRQLVIDKVSNNKAKGNLNVNGIKWTPTNNNDDNGGDDVDETPSAETSSEKVADSLLLPQDVENNSIDGETQRSSISRVSKASSGSKSLIPLYKQQLNDSMQIDSNKETQQITNKSRADAEDADLQYLSNTSDPEDQGIFEIGSVPIVSKAITVPPVGVPDHCDPGKEVTECQSVCCEDTNNLSARGVSENESTINNSFETDSIQNGSNRGHQLVGPPHVADPAEHAVEKMFKTISKDEQPVEVKESEPPTPIGGDIDEVKQHKLNEAKRKVITPVSKGSDKQVRECFPLMPWIRSETFNVTLGTELFCFNGGHNLNMTYTIPLSKFMRETKIELHFGGTNILHWTLCSSKQRTSHSYVVKDVDTTNNVNHGKISLKSPNKSVFYLHLPSYGFFEHHAVFKATLDSVKNACQEQPDEAMNLLQYNIRIFRDCD